MNHRPSRSNRSRWTSAPWLVCAAIGLSAPEARAIPGIEGMFEYALDAPWRIEPSLDPEGRLVYGSIPIQISIHDERDIQADRRAIDSDVRNLPVRLGNFCRIVVRERQVGDGEDEQPSGAESTYPFEALAEVEATRQRWPEPEAEPRDDPEYSLCRRWAGEDCSTLQGISQTQEWHALLWHPPSAPDPGRTLSLEVEAVITREPEVACGDASAADLVSLINELRVSLGPQPLPRFGSNWLYGDLHYHAQGTDNEGESAYAYRGVLRAMGSMGLDFAFATEHASNSQKLTDVDVFADLTFIDIHEGRIGLRDMSEDRFRFLRSLLHSQLGVNREASFRPGLPHPLQNARSYGVVPQLFLGGEVDLIPELAPEVEYGDVLGWGNRQTWSTKNLCTTGRTGFELIDQLIQNECESLGLLDVVGFEPEARLVRDLQGLGTGFSRHHVVYLPKSASDSDAFVASNTNAYGGASKRFSLLRTEFERHGYFFLAHPLSHPEAKKPDPGPSDLPWTDHLFDQVWRSPACLGLQFWNEDTRLKEKVAAWHEEAFPEQPPRSDFHCAFVPGANTPAYYVCPVSGDDVGFERLDRPAIGGGLLRPDSGLVPVDFPRAGIENSLFHLKVGAPITGRWDEVESGVEEKLHHGAFTWDRLNHWGLDIRGTRDLSWLTFGEPRRMYMAGGSDAHGDLNYRRTGYMVRTDGITDTAIGKPRNLVDVGVPLGSAGVPEGGTTPIATHIQAQVVSALAEGRFSVTDGPALRIVVDRNENGVIDPSDPGMGDVVELGGARSVPLLVEWKSTLEFGPIGIIDLYVGARSSEYDDRQDGHREGRTYARSLAGVFHASIPGIQDEGYPPATDDPYVRMPEGYWRDETGELSFIPGNRLAGVERLSLNLDRFPGVGKEDREANLVTDRFFVRGYASSSRDDVPCTTETIGLEQSGCIQRYAFTNPIWLIDNTYVCSDEAGLDGDAPVVACNTPATIVPPGQPVSFTATATDVCDVTIAASNPECFSFTKKGKKIARDCVVTTVGDTVTVFDGGGVASHVRWQLSASDEAGNTGTTACELQLVRPSK